MRRIMSVVAALTLGVAATACSNSDDTAEEELAAVTAERDALLAAAEHRQDRRDRALTVLDEIEMLLDDPTTFGTEEEVADLLGSHATDDALMDDDVFGAVNYRDGFYNTLYAGALDASIDIYDTWVSADGSQGGALWMWHGENANGEAFELAGVSLIEFDDHGKIAYELVTYPYPDEYVRSVIMGGGTG